MSLTDDHFFFEGIRDFLKLNLMLLQFFPLLNKGSLRRLKIVPLILENGDTLIIFIANNP